MSYLYLRTRLERTALLSALVCLTGASPVFAQIPLVAGQAANQAIKLDEIATLKSAKQLLEAANHDYKGHRASAVHAIHKAIAAIEQRGHRAGVKRSQTNSGAGGARAKGLHAQAAKTPAAREDQGASDAQLRAAQQLLVKVQAELATGKHPKASAHVQVAMKEIQTALAIK
jgi:hypothetical protein